MVNQYWNLKLGGQVTYPDRTIRIPAEVVDDQFVQNLVALIRRLADDNSATRVPSARECRFCDMTAADCPVRVDGDGEPRSEIPSNSEAQQSPDCRLPALARPLNARIDLGEPNQPLGFPNPLMCPVFADGLQWILNCYSGERRASRPVPALLWDTAPGQTG